MSFCAFIDLHQNRKNSFFPWNLKKCLRCWDWSVVACVQATLQVGGHGERLHQCKEVTLTTYKSIPMQVDGEPCKLAPSVIHINLRNQANMVQKAKRRISMPHLNEYKHHCSHVLFISNNLVSLIKKWITPQSVNVWDKVCVSVLSVCLQSAACPREAADQSQPDQHGGVWSSALRQGPAEGSLWVRDGLKTENPSLIIMFSSQECINAPLRAACV